MMGTQIHYRGSMILALLLTACVSTGPTKEHSAFSFCQEVIKVGLFTDEVFACFPEAAAAAKVALCKSFPSVGALGHVGFGLGTVRMFGPAYCWQSGRRDSRVHCQLDTRAVARWQEENCNGQTKWKPPSDEIEDSWTAEEIEALNEEIDALGNRCTTCCPNPF